MCVCVRGCVCVCVCVRACVPQVRCRERVFGLRRRRRAECGPRKQESGLIRIRAKQVGLRR